MAAQIVLPFESKTCNACFRELPIGSFNRNKNLRDGHTGHCKACAKEKMAKYYADPAFRERVKAKVRTWQSANKEKVIEFKQRSAKKHRKKNLEQASRRKKKNRDKINVATRKHYHANIDRKRDSARRTREEKRERYRELARAQYHKDIEKSRATSRRNAKLRRIRMATSSAGFSEAGWMQKCEYWGWHCYLCGCALTFETATLDHRIPVVKGGPHMLSNLAPSCRHCNCSKRHTSELEYRQSFGFPLRATTGISPRLPS